MDIDPNMYTHVFTSDTHLLFQSQGPDWIGPGMQVIPGGRLSKLLFREFSPRTMRNKRRYLLLYIILLIMIVVVGNNGIYFSQTSPMLEIFPMIMS